MRILKILLCVLLCCTTIAWGRSGGSFGGSSSSNSSSNKSSSSSSSNSNSGSRSNSGSYNSNSHSTTVVVVGNGGYSGTGYNSSSSDDSDGFVFFIVLLVIGGVVYFMWLQRKKNGAGNAEGSSRALRVQLMLAEGDQVKRALSRIAEEGDADSDEGLQSMLSDAVLVMLRHPDRWMYGYVEQTSGSEERVAQQIGTWGTQARSQYDEETIRNEGGRIRRRAAEENETGGLYLVVSLLAASSEMPALSQQNPGNAQIREALGLLSGITAGDLLRIDVIWSPDQEGEFLDEEEAIRKYPELYKL